MAPTVFSNFSSVSLLASLTRTRSSKSDKVSEQRAISIFVTITHQNANQAGCQVGHTNVTGGGRHNDERNREKPRAVQSHGQMLKMRSVLYPFFSYRTPAA
jgi:hypothetical protein